MGPPEASWLRVAAYTHCDELNTRTVCRFRLKRTDLEPRTVTKSLNVANKSGGEILEQKGTKETKGGGHGSDEDFRANG